MNYYREYPFTTSISGVRYVLIFSEFDNQDYNTPVIDITLVCEDNLEQANDVDVLININNFIKDYLSQFKNVIIYYYCDKAPIVKSKKNQNLSNQEYRHILFNRMFEFSKFNSVIKKSIIINDPEEGNHYINLIGNTSLYDTIEKIALDINKINNK